VARDNNRNTGEVQMRFGGCLAGGSMLALLIVASLSMQPVASQEKFYVCYVNTVEKEVPHGKTVTVIFGVFYALPYYSYYVPCGEPCVLKTRAGQAQPTGSFEVRGSASTSFIDVPLTPTGKPGEYKLELSWLKNAPIGRVVVFIVKDSLYDGKTTGPGQDSSHAETPDPTDDSTYTSSTPAHSTIALFDFMPGGFATFAGLLTFFILWTAVVVMVLRVRRRQKWHQTRY